MHGRYGVLLLIAGMLAGCTTLQQTIALRSVAFQVDRITEVRMAGVDLSRVRTYSDLSLGDGARVTAALASGELPLSFRLHLLAENPPGNNITARLSRLRWTLLLEDTETVSGDIDREYVMPPGRPVEIPLDISLDLVDFYERSGRDLVELALNLSKAGGAPKQVAIRAVPTITTPLGPITYPRPITIVSGTLGHPDPASGR